MLTLPPATDRLWRRLENEPLLAGSYLIGGTALTLLIGHRQSEDLDFVWPCREKLPVQLLRELTAKLEAESWNLERDDDNDAYDEFLIAGTSLHDYQQNFIATAGGDRVKLTFFSPGTPLATLLPESDAPNAILPPLPLLFQTKALAACSRSTVRDWVDLYVLMTRHRFTMDDFVAAYDAAGSKMQLDLAFNRLASGQPRAGDPGVAGLMDRPPSVEDLAAFFRENIRLWKLRRAGKEWQQ